MKIRWKLAQFFEIVWWQRYLKQKPVRDYLEWKTQYWNDFLKAVGVSVSPGEDLLDVGCGPAGIFLALKDHKMDALDPLLPEYERRLSHFSPSFYPNTRFVPEPFETFEPGRQYDRIFCLNVINHVADLGRSLQKLSDLLKPGGTLVLSVDAHNYWGFKHIFRLIPGDILHPHQYDLEEYKRMVGQTGLRIEKFILYKKEFFFNYHILTAVK